MPSVNSTRLRRSETAKMFFRLSFTASCSVAPPAAGDLLRRLAAELVRAHRQRLADLAARQHLHRGLPCR